MTGAGQSSARDRPYRGLPAADLVTAGWCWRVLRLGDRGYAIERRASGERTLFRGDGEMDGVFVSFAGLTDRDLVDDMAEAVAAYFGPDDDWLTGTDGAAA
jgi:hypothetical protein